MRCRKHLSDSTSTIGVCATCLHEKLAAISENPNPNCCNKSQPLISSRSTSPCNRPRKSDQSSNSNSTITPQVCAKRESTKSAGKFNLIAKLFRSKSSPVTTPAGGGPTELTRFRTRGMSPENESRTRPSQGRVKQSPARLTNNVASFAFCLSPLVRASPGAGRRYNWGVGGGETSAPVAGKGVNGGVSGGGGGNNGGVNSKKVVIGETASYCRNRSRKVADFGRGNWNR